MRTVSESWPERVMNRLRSSADDSLDVLSFDARRLLLSLLLGVIGGLILGLFLGWVVWPVQWSNTRPAHLEPDAKAQFIAAVADAYIATGSDPVALETARMRLIGMEDADFTTSLAYFANTIPGSAVAQNPDLESDSVYRQYAEQRRLSFDSNIRLNNITQLAGDLGVQVDTATTTGGGAIAPAVQNQNDAQPLDNAAQTVEQTTNQSTEGASPAAVDNTGGLFVGGLGRAVACLTALMLVLGGVYILVRLDQRMQWLKGALDRFRDPESPRTSKRDFGKDSYEQEELGYSSTRSTRRSSAASSDDAYYFDRDDLALDPEMVHADTELDAPDGFDDDDLGGFDDDDFRYGNGGRSRSFVEDDDDYPEYPERDTDVGPAAISAQASSSIPASVPRPPSQPQRRERMDEPSFDDDDHEPDYSAYRGGTGSRRDNDVMPDPPPPTDYVEPPTFDDDIWPVSAQANARQNFGEAAASPNQADTNRSSGERRPARTRRKVLEYTARFKRGERAQYEENQHIFIDGDGVDSLGRNVGECGLGVNFKNGILLNNPHDVIAFDVWLLDKVKTEMLTSVKRILISEYVIERKLEDVIQREIHSDGEPLVPQPGLEFELQGANLSLTCRVLEASYLHEGEQAGVFNTLAMQMTVYAKV